MVVITLTDCPPKLRGDLTKWMLEVNTGVYVGYFSTRVRAELWKRVCSSSGHGRATMVYSTDGEQHFGFETCRSTWVPVDYDGVTLISHMTSGDKMNTLEAQSKIRKQIISRSVRNKCDEQLNETPERKEKAKRENAIEIERDSIAILDVIITDTGETTIINVLVVKELREKITITVKSDYNYVTLVRGSETSLCTLQEAIKVLRNATLGMPLVGYSLLKTKINLRNICRMAGVEFWFRDSIDVLTLARQNLHGLPDYKLVTVAKEMKVNPGNITSEMDFDLCEVIEKIYAKLKKNG